MKRIAVDIGNATARSCEDCKKVRCRGEYREHGFCLEYEKPLRVSKQDGAFLRLRACRQAEIKDGR